MNKLLAITLLTFVAVASASDEFHDLEAQVDSKTEKEVELVTGVQEPFKQFCLETRDSMWSDINDNANTLSGKFFTYSLTVMETLGGEVLASILESRKRISDSLENPKSEIQPAQNAGSQILEEAQNEIQSGMKQPQALVTGFKASAAAVAKNFAEIANKKLQEIKQQFRIQNIAMVLEEVCKKVSEYNADFMSKFEETKKMLDGVEDVTYAELGCRTVRTIDRFDGICKLSSSALPHVGKVVGNVFRNSRFNPFLGRAVEKEDSSATYEAESD